MTALKQLCETAPLRDPAEVLARALAEMREQKQSVDGVCPFWQECHQRWKVSDKYQCAFRRDHRVALCGTYKSRQ